MKINKTVVLNILIQPEDIAYKYHFHEDDLIACGCEIYVIKEIEISDKGVELTMIPYLHGVDIFKITSGYEDIIQLYNHTK